MPQLGQSSRSMLFPVFLLIISMVSIQSSATLAKTLFPLIGPEGVTALRLGFSSLILLAVFRPWRNRVPLRAWRSIIVYGVALGFMNLTFYMAIKTIPLGIAVALEFTGPLAVAMLSSRKVVDFFWIGLAVLGLYLLLPIGDSIENVDPKGAMLALSAGVCWALYIIFGKRAGSASGSASVALGTLVAASIIFPIGFYHAGTAMFSPSILPIALLVGIFSSALPYGLEIVALTRLPSQTFGTLMSVEPALAALFGYIFLHEALTTGQWAALLCIIVASIGATMTIGKSKTAIKEIET